MRPVLPAVLREEAQFRRLFLGQALSTTGDRIAQVALPFAVLSIGGGAGEVGLVVAASALPFFALSLVGGVWADRLPRQRVMLASDLVRMATQATLAVLLFTGEATVGLMVALMAVFGTADAFFSPAVTGVVPSVVPPHRVQAATALLGLQRSVGNVLGPAVAGVLIAVLDPGGAIAVDAATFTVSAGFLAGMHVPAARRIPDAAERFGAQLAEGFAAVRSRGWVVAALGAVGIYHVVVLPAIFVLGPVLAERDYGGATDWAIVSAGFGLGSIVGDLVVLRWRPSRPLVVSMAALVVASSQAAIIGSGLSIPAIAALEAVAGVGVSMFFTLWEVTLQEQIPPQTLSRVSSYDYLVSVGLMPIGLALAGPVSEVVGLHATLDAMTAIGVATAVAVGAVPTVRALRREPATVRA